MRSHVAHLIGPLLGRIPIRCWPGFLAPLTGVLLPRAVVPHRQVTGSGGANVSMLLDFLDRTAGLEGDVAECGVWRGRSLIAMGIYLRQAQSRRTLWGFDSFEGFDQEAPHKFKDASLHLVELKAAIFGMSNIRVVPGYFRDSFQAIEDRGFSFVHVDCDIYESYIECLEFFFPRMVVNGVILFDEYDDPDWPGATRAVDEFCRQANLSLNFVVRDNFRKAFIVKTN
jgi:hypothetical protein